MAVQILNDMPDVAVNRGDPITACLRDLHVPRVSNVRKSGRAGFLAITIGLHVVAAFAFMQMTRSNRVADEPVPIVASLIESPADADEKPPEYTPPPVNLVYSLPSPQEITFDTEPLTTQISVSNAITTQETTAVVPPLVESVEYLRTEPLVYPRESQRRREHGTVLLRVLVDALGRPAQIQVERSSGYVRLDNAARDTIAKFLFRPYEVNGVAQPAQVLIPVGFDPPRKT